MGDNIFTEYLENNTLITRTEIPGCSREIHRHPRILYSPDRCRWTIKCSINDIVDRLNRTEKRRKIVHDVWKGRLEGQYLADLKKINNTISGRNILLISEHYLPGFEHFHVLHDCNWSSRSCSCTLFTGGKQSRLRRTTVWTNDITRNYWNNITKYFFIQPKRNRVCVIGKSHIEVLDEPANNQSSQSQEFGEEGFLEGPGTRDFLRCTFGEPIADVVDGASEINESTSEKRIRLSGGNKTSQIVDFISKYVICPPTNACLLRQWFEQEQFETITRGDDVYNLSLIHI